MNGPRLRDGGLCRKPYACVEGCASCDSDQCVSVSRVHVDAPARVPAPSIRGCETLRGPASGTTVSTSRSAFAATSEARVCARRRGRGRGSACGVLGTCLGTCVRERAASRARPFAAFLGWAQNIMRTHRSVEVVLLAQGTESFLASQVSADSHVRHVPQGLSLLTSLRSAHIAPLPSQSRRAQKGYTAPVATTDASHIGPHVSGPAFFSSLCSTAIPYGPRGP